MNDPTPEDNLNLLIDLAGRHLPDERADLVHPILDFANGTQSPHTTLVVFAGAAVMSYAKLLIAIFGSAEAALQQVEAEKFFDLIRDTGLGTSDRTGG